MGTGIEGVELKWLEYLPNVFLFKPKVTKNTIRVFHRNLDLGEYPLFSSNFGCITKE